MKMILTCNFGLKKINLTSGLSKRVVARTGSGLVFVWASELYSSKKEYTFEVLDHALEGPIIKSGPVGGWCIPNLLFSLFIALLNKKTHNFRFRFALNPTFYNLHLASPDHVLQHLFYRHSPRHSNHCSTS